MSVRIKSIQCNISHFYIFVYPCRIHNFKKNLRVNLYCVITAFEIKAEENHTIRSPDSSQNTFRLWDFKALDGYVISLSFDLVYISNTFDGYMYISFGDNAENYSMTNDSCTWTRMNDGTHLKFSEFTSRSSSVKLIFWSLITKVSFSVTLRAVRSKGKWLALFLFLMYYYGSLKICTIYFL